MINKEILKRIHYVIGQLQGVEKMITEERDPVEIYAQLISARSALKNSVIETMDTEYRYKLAESLVEDLEKCDGTCGMQDTLIKFKKDFPKMTSKEVFSSLKVIRSQLFKE